MKRSIVYDTLITIHIEYLVFIQIYATTTQFSQTITSTGIFPYRAYGEVSSAQSEKPTLTNSSASQFS